MNRPAAWSGGSCGRHRTSVRWARATTADLRSCAAGAGSTLLAGPAEQVEELADRPLAADRVGQRKMSLDLISVPTTILDLQHVSGVSKVGHDAVRGALGDGKGDGQVAQPCARLGG